MKRKPAFSYQLTALYHAFTLIELLVVIAIIGILATLLIANINASRARARDAQRKADLRNIQTALRLYYNDFSVYPESNDENKIQGCIDGTQNCEWNEGGFSTSTATYMSILPGDPSPDRNYQYQKDPDINDVYTLKACLENKSDDRCGTDEAWCTTLDGCVYLVQP